MGIKWKRIALGVYTSKVNHGIVAIERIDGLWFGYVGCRRVCKTKKLAAAKLHVESALDPKNFLLTVSAICAE